MLPTMQVSSNCLQWNRQGFIPLPEDSYETYAERVEKLQGATSSSQDLACLVHIYDLNPSWVPVEYSSEGLWPWEAGCTWYSDLVDEPPAIQLKSQFEHSNRYLGIYSKSEVLAHEYVHAVRAGLGSSSFEEIFSYLISFAFARGRVGRCLHAFRVALGPLFQEPWESLVLLTSFLVTILLMMLELYFDSYESSLITLLRVPVALLTTAIVGYFLIRLTFRWWQWHRCKSHLDVLMKQSSLPLMVRLTDEEIVLFSTLSPTAISEWIACQTSNFRWKLLSQAYLFT